MGSIRDYLLGGPDAATGSVDAPGLSALGEARREAIPADAPRGIRNNNPGNIRKSDIQWQGEVPGADSAFETFDSPESGLRALETNLRTYQNKHGLNTVRGIIGRWAPPTENDTGSYVNAVAGALGVRPDDPIDVNDPAVRTKLRDAIVRHENGQNPYAGAGAFSSEQQGGSIRAMLLAGGIPEPEVAGGVTAGDFGRALAVTAGDFAKAPVGALENLVGQLAGDESDATERRLANSQRGLGDVRRSIGEWQKGFFDSMSPEALDRAQRELLTLDPQKTIWKGGPGEFLSSIALKGTLSLGPTIGPMITTALLARLGVGAAASTLYGAQEGLVSAGLSASAIADNVEQTSLEELRKVQRFRVLEEQVGEAEARRQFTNEVQGIVPAVTGILVGSIAKVVGKPLDKIFGTGQGLPLLERIKAGAITETLQEGPQSFSEQVLQNYAEMAYKADVNLLDGAAEQTVQGMLLGGIMGGTFAGAFGNRPRNPLMSSDPIAPDRRAALGGMSPTPPAATAPPPPTAIPEQSPFGPGPDGEIARRIADEYAARGERLSMSDLDILVQQEKARGAAPELSLRGPPPQLGDRLALQEDTSQMGQESVPFEPPFPDTLPGLDGSDSIEPPPPPPPGPPGGPPRGPRWRPNIKAPRRGLEANTSDWPESGGALPEAPPPSLSPVEKASRPWDPNAAQPAEPVDTTEVVQPGAPQFVANQNREPKWGRRTRTEQLGFRVRVRNQDGSVASSQLVEGKSTAKILAKRAEKTLQPGQFIELLPARRTFLNEETPTAEPTSDIMAQIRDMNSRDALDFRLDPDARRAVYITRESLDNLREAGLLEQALSGGVPIENFDTYGGVLLAKDEDTAQELLQFIEDPDSNIDEVIGYATGAGNGKPGGTNPVVQMLDDDGNVIRERQVTPEEARQTQQRWGATARVLSLDKALMFRQARLEREQADREQARQQQAFAAQQPGQQVAELMRERSLTGPFAEEAQALVSEAVSEQDAATKLTQLATKQRSEERVRRTLARDIPAPQDLQFRGRETGEKEGAAARLEREGKAAEAKKLRASTASGGAKREELVSQYAELYARAEAAAERLDQVSATGSMQDVDAAQEELDTLLEELRAMLVVEGGYTKSEALQRAANQYSPKGARAAVQEAARKRDERQVKEDAKKEEPLQVVRMERAERFGSGSRNEQILSRGDEGREEKKVRNIVEAQKVSVETMAEALDKIRKRTSTPEGMRLVEQLFSVLSPTMARDLDQLVDQVDASAAIAKLEKKLAAGKISQKQFEWRKKRAVEKKSEQHRTEVATALLEINQLLRQWLTDYRNALRYQTPATDTLGKSRDSLIAARAAELSEMLGQLKAWHQGDIGVADDAARFLAHRIARLVVTGKRVGVGTEMDIDGFWSAAEKGPIAFRDYLADTVRSREEQWFPLDLTEESLKTVSPGTLNALYLRAVSRLGSSRVPNQQRREIVDALMKGLEARGVKLSSEPVDIKVRMWDDRLQPGSRTVALVEPKKRTSPRQLMRETFTRSYGVRGASSAMSDKQLAELYLEGGTVTVLTKGKRTVVTIKPIGKSLPEVDTRNTTPEQKRRMIMRAVRASNRRYSKEKGGRVQTTGLTREAKSGGIRTRAETKYSPGVLLDDSEPRELSEKARAEYEQKRDGARRRLSDTLELARQFSAKLGTKTFQKEALAADVEASTAYQKAKLAAAEIGDEFKFVYTSYVNARAYFNWLVEYAKALDGAKLKSRAAFREMDKVSEDLTKLAQLPAGEFVAAVEQRFRAEENEQRLRAIALDPVNLKRLHTPEGRAAVTAETLDRVSKTIAFHNRLTKLWAGNKEFNDKILPVLNTISESLAAVYRGEFQRSGRDLVPQFTDDQRQDVEEILLQWKTAKDSYSSSRKAYQQWGVPASVLHDQFYMPLHQMLREAGFFDPDQALLKRYNRRFEGDDPASTGAVDVQQLDSSGMPMQRRFATPEADPAALAEIELRRRNQENIDRQLAAMDEDTAWDDDTTIMDRGRERKITPDDRARREGLLDSSFGKTATTAKKLLSVNEIIDAFSQVLNNPNAGLKSIQFHERRMIERLSELGLWKSTGKDLGTIGLPDAGPAIEKLEKEQAGIYARMAKLSPEWHNIQKPLADLRGQLFGKQISQKEFDKQKAALEKSAEDEFLANVSRKSPTASDTYKEVEELTEQLQASVQALKMVREAQLGFKDAKTLAYRLVGPRLVAREISRADARTAAGKLLKGFSVPTQTAKDLGRTEALAKGKELRSRAAAAAREERRRSTMSPEARSAAEALDRRYGVPMPAVNGPSRPATDAEARAAIELRSLLKDSWARKRHPDGLQGYMVVRSLLDTLGQDHFYAPLLKAFQRMPAVMQMPVTMQSNLPSAGMFMPQQGPNESDTGAAVAQSVAIDRTSVDDLSHNELIHTVVHEFVHAASMQSLTEGNPDVTAAWEELRQMTYQSLKNAPDFAEYSGAFGNLYEFVAEVFSNRQLQWAMKSTRVPNVPRTMWQKLLGILRKIFSLPIEYNSLLDVAASLQPLTLGGDPYTTRAHQKYLRGYKGAVEATRGVPFAAPFVNELIERHQLAKDLQARVKAAADSGKVTGMGAVLYSLTMRQIAQLYNSEFGGEGGPLSKYTGAWENRNSYSSELLEGADRLSTRWTSLEEKGEEGVELSRLMHDATVNGVHADKPGTSLHARFAALSPEAQQLYRDIREYYKATQKREVQLMLASALRASKLWPGGEINHEEIDLEGITKGDWLQKKLGIDVKAEEAKLKAAAKTLDKKALKAREADLENTKEELKLIARMANIPSMQEGPYFPLMRFGDYVVRAERTVATEEYATRKERTEAMERWSEQDPTLQFSWAETDGGTFPLVVKEVEFRLAETITEANDAREDLLKLYEGGTVSEVMLKRALLNETATINSNQALQTLLGRLEKNPAAQNAIREFYIKSLSDRSFRKREAKRKNIRGADPTKQHRTFGAYAKSASYYTAQLRYGHVMATAKAEMQKYVETPNTARTVSAIRLGQVVKEIERRDEQAANLTDAPAITRKLTEVGQLWLLLSPSYWMINLSQPYLVTIPWLAARSSTPKAVTELIRAQKLIIDPLVSQGVQSWGGLKALKSRFAAEQAFRVLDNVTGSIESNLRAQGQDPQPILDMLTQLKRESIIDLSFVAELRDVAEGEQYTKWNKIMDASRVLAHLTEVNNRITTAIAAYNVAISNTNMSHEKAVAFAKNAVAETQFDYSAANKPRLFSANDAWWKPVIFQFMQYVQHMYVLFIRHLGMWKEGGKVGETGRRMVIGLLLTHMAVGGLSGATPQIAKWALGLAMWLFGAGDDDDRTFKNWVSGEYFERMLADATSAVLPGKAGEALRAGLPRLAGFDLSTRTALLQSHFVDLNTETRETLYGSLVTSFGGPMFGIFGNALDAVELAVEGDADKAWEKLLPKMGRDALRMWRYFNEGLVDHTGKTILGSDEMSPWELFLTSLGFAPSQIAEVYSRNSRARGAETFVAKRKAEITAAYRKAGSTGELESVMADWREFNRQFPKDRITFSELLRGARRMREAERNIQRYGVDAGRRSAEYSDDSYNVE